jgi:paraquat-inducible protein A
VKSAISCSLHRCHACDLLARVTPLSDPLRESRCQRCGSTLYARKPHSLQATVALIVAAAILYIPANLLPILLSLRVGHYQEDTILSGVVALWLDGAWPLSILVFLVSIVVPTLKLLALSFLVLTTHCHWRLFLHERAVLYRLIEFIGRWSMLDVFVVALLVALVQLRSVATVAAGPGALAFAAVVVLTVFAAQAFDPRLMWDEVEQ